jgi:hypothetical protein
VTGRVRATLTIGASLLGSILLTVAPATHAAAASPAWLDRFNAWRANANVPALAENTTWDQGDYNHSVYMVKDDQVTHYELSNLPYYTVIGDTAARNGNIQVSSTTSMADDSAIDWWMAAPFHELGMMDPRLSSTGFGSYREVKSGWQAGFTLDVLRGNSFQGGTYPVLFPGNNSSMPLTSYKGGEFPDPLSACSGYSAPTGLPITIQVGGNVTTTVGAHAFTGNGAPLTHCVIDSNNPSLGSSLKSRGAVILIPQQPLQAGVSYTVALTVNGVPYTWSFGVTSDNTITSAQACPVTFGALAATESTTQFSVTASVSNCTASSIAFQQFDTTLNAGWFNLSGAAPVAGTATQVVEGYRGHAYQFRARALSGGGLVGPWSAAGTTTVSATATGSHPFAGMYTLDGYGGVDADVSPPLAGSAYWPGWRIARAAHAEPGAISPQSGLVLDGYGGLHPYGAAITTSGGPYWGWDIGRDFALLPDGTGGYVLDGYGGLHPFGVNGHAAPVAASGSPYWGWDVARKVVIFSDGSGGYVLDAFGGLHPFGIGGAAPGPAVGASYWGWNIAHDLALIPGTHAGYVLDGYGGLHGFNGAPAEAATAYWGGWDIARGVWMLPGSTLSTPQGYTLDGWGGLHPFGGAPALGSTPYWPGNDMARQVWGA